MAHQTTPFHFETKRRRENGRHEGGRQRSKKNGESRKSKMSNDSKTKHKRAIDAKYEEGCGCHDTCHKQSNPGWHIPRAHGALLTQAPTLSKSAADLLDEAATGNLGHQPLSSPAAIFPHCTQVVSSGAKSLQASKGGAAPQISKHTPQLLSPHGPQNKTQLFSMQRYQGGKGQQLLQLQVQIGHASHYGSLDPPSKGYELCARYVSLVLEDPCGHSALFSLSSTSAREKQQKPKPLDLPREIRRSLRL